MGAGVASGREIMHFFTRYGLFSWGLIAAAVTAAGFLIFRVMEAGSMEALFGKGALGRGGKICYFLLLICTGGGMASAAGELFALTVPLVHARWLGFFLTLALCLLLSRRFLGALRGMGRLLLPALGIAFFLCLRVPGGGISEMPFNAGRAVTGILSALSYAGMNVLLSAGVLTATGKGEKRVDKKKKAALAAGTMGLVLAGGNAALMAHGAEMQYEALPVVRLLHGYGKMGYYLSALVLYLAVASTLIAVLGTCQGLLKGRFPRAGGAAAGLMAAGIGLLGFERIVSAAYPVLGFICFVLLALPKGGRIGPFGGKQPNEKAFPGPTEGERHDGQSSRNIS